jgi:hypothetical protein
MSDNRPLRGALFFYESFRLLLLAALFAFFPPLEGAGRGALFPYLACASPNALFPLMALFLWLGLREYGRYLPLYLAGKLVALAAFCAWGFFAFAPALQAGNFGTADLGAVLVLLGGGFFVGLGDVFSIFGTWFLINKMKAAEASEPDRAVPGTGENGGI